MNITNIYRRTAVSLTCWFCAAVPATFANIPGGGTGTGPNVTVVDNGNGTVTMANGIISILITKVVGINIFWRLS